jgi:uncharacterized protein YgbK (DUF1537 family)
MTPLADLLPKEIAVPAAQVRTALAGARRVVFLDDDPTGTQTVRDLPVLTRWTDDDITWALRQDTAGFFILTNTRSLDPQAAAQRDRDVVSTCLRVAESKRVQLVFASRSDSTLRGHFPLETDVISDVVAAGGGSVDGVLLAPAYVDAGRLTVNGVHLVCSSSGLIPVADSEFARDATFGYRSSRLSDWAAEKSGGRIRPHDVIEIPLAAIRSESTDELAARLAGARDRQVVVVDAVTDDDLRAVALAVLSAEQKGATYVYRIGPSFVRARTGQDMDAPVPEVDLRGLVTSGTHGLVVVGSHVALTSRQLVELAKRCDVTTVELDVNLILAGNDVQRHIDDTVAAVTSALGTTTVVLRTTRTPVTGADEAASLDISRRVSSAVSATVSRVVAEQRPSFVVAKGGITSSDTATQALGIDRAWVRGPVLRGIVSLWEPVSGPAAGLPYVVFAGNVGHDDALADVVQRLEEAS